MNNIKEKYVNALGKSLYILLIKVFTLPLKILDRSIVSVTSKDNDENTDFPVLMWVKKLFDAYIVIIYPLGLIALIIASIDMYDSVGEFIFGLIYVLVLESYVFCSTSWKWNQIDFPARFILRSCIGMFFNSDSQ